MHPLRQQPLPRLFLLICLCLGSTAHLQDPEQSGLARAQQQLLHAQKAVAARRAEVAAAEEQLTVCEKRLKQAKEAKAQSKASTKSSPAKSSQGAAGMIGAVPLPVAGLWQANQLSTLQQVNTTVCRCT